MTTIASGTANQSARLSPDKYRLLLQNDFHTFPHRSFCELNPRVPFLNNWRIAVLAAKLEKRGARHNEAADRQPAAFRRLWTKLVAGAVGRRLMATKRG